MMSNDWDDGIPVECPRCNGSGEVGVKILHGYITHVVPGPVPDDAAGYHIETCGKCRGMGYVEE